MRDVGTSEEREKSAAVIELGAAAESRIVHGEFSSGPYVALEFEAVRDWLEIEIGVSPQFGSHQTDLASEFILKTPVFCGQTGSNVGSWTAMGISRDGG